MKNFFITIISLVTFLFLEQSCQRIDTTDLGVGLIPAVDNVNTFEAILEVKTDNVLLPDSTIISRTANHALGVLEDPEFGTTVANVYFDVLPTTSGTNPFVNKDSINGKVDSVILSLDYAGFYGDSTSLENIGVYEIARTADFSDTSYMISHPDFTVLPTPLKVQTVDFTTLNDPHVIKKGKDTTLVTEENIVRLRLDNSLGLRLAGYDTTNAYASDSAFRTYFRGFALKAALNGTGSRKALAYINLTNNAKTRLTVYYRTVSNGTPDTTFTEFVYKNQVAISANLIKRNTDGSNYIKNLAVPGKNKEKLYLQSSPGSYASLTIPGLDTMSNKLIYRAELVVNELYSPFNQIFRQPDYLFLDYFDSTTNLYSSLIRDFSVSADGYNADFGMLPKPVVNSTNEQVLQWKFNISRYVQGILTRKEKNHVLRLYAPYLTTINYNYSGSGLLNGALNINTNIAKGRAILGGGSHPSQPMKVRIIYSKVL